MLRSHASRLQMEHLYRILNTSNDDMQRRWLAESLPPRTLFLTERIYFKASESSRFKPDDETRGFVMCERDRLEMSSAIRDLDLLRRLNRPRAASSEHK